MERSVLIIGAGVAGLAAGIYGQQCGFRTRIFELHKLPGGLCTAWERKGYVFDGCLHYLFGSGPGRPFHRLWEELGLAPQLRMIHHEELLRVRGSDGRTLVVHADLDRLQEHLLQLSPADHRRIRRLVAAARKFTSFDLSLLQERPRSALGLAGWARLGARMARYLPELARYGFLSARRFAARFRDPFLRRAVAQMFSWPEMPVMVGLALLAAMHTRNAGFPAGASLAFARALERRYLELGGRIDYGAQVERILVEHDRAVGVRLYSNDEHRGDYVVSAADGRGTIFDLLGGRYASRRLRRFYDGRFPLHSMIQVSLGVNRDFVREPHWTVHLLDAPRSIAGREQHELHVKHFGFDPGLAPPGRSVVEVMCRIDYDYFQRIYGRRLYDTEQDEVAELVLEQLERFHPGLRRDVEVIDVATPLSYERYTGNWQGSSCGWLLTPRLVPAMIRGLPKTLPGLGRCFLAGQWVEPGGSVPVVAMSGRNAIQLICREEGRPFGIPTG
jgi:phytoene dehydrogenase-like protein